MTGAKKKLLINEISKSLYKIMLIGLVKGIVMMSLKKVSVKRQKQMVNQMLKESVFSKMDESAEFIINKVLEEENG